MSERRLRRAMHRIFILFIALMAAIVGISVYTWNAATDLYRETVYERLEERALQYQQSFVSQMNTDLLVLRTWAGTVTDARRTDGQDIVRSLISANQETDFLRVGYIAKDGAACYWDTDNNAIFATTVGEYTPEMQQTIAQSMEGKALCSKTHYSPELGRTVLGYSVPVYDTAGEIQGVLAADICTEVYSDLLTAVDVLGKTGEAAIVRGNGDVLVSTKEHEEKPFFNISDSEYLSDEAKQKYQKALASSDTFCFDYEVGGIRYYTCVLGMGVLTAHVVLTDDDRGISSSSIDLAQISQVTNLVSVFFCTLLVMALFVLVSNYQKYITRIAYYDSLTGAYNKRKFTAIVTERREKGLDFSLVAVNIRKFKFINELFGSAQSDKLLRLVYKTIQENLTEQEFCCRESADSFLLYLDELDSFSVEQRLNRILEQVNQKAENLCSNYQVQFYCGCATTMTCEARNDFEELLSHAMMAQQQAKADQCICGFYDAALHDREKQISYIENNMERALRDGEFQMFLQPKINLNDGTLHGAEALVRWIRDGKTFLYPDQFIPLFEQNGFCKKLDLYMMEQACKQIRAWLDRGYKAVPISINQTKLLFFEEDYPEKLYAVSRSYKVQPEYITIEILEGLALEDVNKLNQCIERLRRYGFRISMDDFGTGYSSLNVLGDLSIDELKLDRAFLMQAQKNPSGQHKKIMAMTIAMAKQMNISVVAEGVETIDNEQLLKELSCDCGQGYLYSKPVAVADFEKNYLTNQECEVNHHV